MSHEGVKTPARKFSPIFLQDTIVSKKLGRDDCLGNGSTNASLSPHCPSSPFLWCEALCDLEHSMCSTPFVDGFVPSLGTQCTEAVVFFRSTPELRIWAQRGAQSLGRALGSALIEQGAGNYGCMWDSGCLGRGQWIRSRLALSGGCDVLGQDSSSPFSTHDALPWLPGGARPSEFSPGSY